jgi:hypothetical protein
MLLNEKEERKGEREMIEKVKTGGAVNVEPPHAYCLRALIEWRWLLMFFDQECESQCI